MHLIPAGVAALAGFLLGACTSAAPPSHPDNLCAIFQEKDRWYAAAHRVHERYRIPINVAMAIMYQESAYRSDIRPPMRWFLFIPYGRGSSAYGYAQAQDAVWEDYVADAGSFFSSRDDFEDALDFIGWYMRKTRQSNGIAYGDAYNQYLNYHEGWTGFRRQSFQSKDWLKEAAAQVQNRAQTYRRQLLSCNLY